MKLNWTGPLWLALIPCMTRYMVASGVAGRWHDRLRRAWPTTIAALLLFYGLGLQYLALGLPAVPYAPNMPAVGRRDLGRQVERLEEQLETGTGVEPLVVGMDRYETASLLAFYRPVSEREVSTGGRESVQFTAGNHLFGGTGLMYRYWFPEATGQAHPMILVSAKRKNLEGPSIRRRVEEAGEIRELTLRKNGRPAARYYYCIVKGYRAAKDWPAKQSPAPSAVLRNGDRVGS